MRRLGIVAVGLALVMGIAVGSIVGNPLDRTASASTPAPAQINATKQWCEGGVVAVTLWWKAEEQWDNSWVDLSLFDNGFAQGTYLGWGPQGEGNAGSLGGYWKEVTWRGLQQGTLHYWRVNLLYGDKWYPSAAQAFVTETCPSGAPSGVSPAPAAAPPPAPIQTSDLEQRLDRLETEVFGTVRYGYQLDPSLRDLIEALQSEVGPLASRIDSLESQVDSLKSCLQSLYVDCWGSTCEIGCK